MAETLIIILAEHNVPINFADHFTKLVSNKLVFPDSVFLRVRAARVPCSLKVVISHVVTNFFSRNLTGLITMKNHFKKQIPVLSWNIIFFLNIGMLTACSKWKFEKVYLEFH